MKARWIILTGLFASAVATAQVHGFVEARIGERTREDPTQDGASIREVRSQLDYADFHGPLDVEFKVDFLYDDLAEERSHIDLRQGRGWMDLRTASVSFQPLEWTDVKVGRQVLTWGTGDLLFINDLFPKDWTSFFIGRDVEYLKAPSDALWIANFVGEWTLDFVWTPRFNPDRHLDGEGVSFGDRCFTSENRMDADEPTGSELAARVSRYFGSVETALYAYDGYWKSPGGLDDQGRGKFPALSVWGGSVMAPGLDGLLNAEVGYYDSREDRSGDDPSVPNSEWRFLLGYTRELRANFTLGLQGYVEWMQHYGSYRRTLPEEMPRRDEVRKVSTVRLTRQLMNQKLTLSGFLFVSPTDEDGYVRASAAYKWTDQLDTTLGANFFFGEEEHTFFGQLEDNSNVYLAMRHWF